SPAGHDTRRATAAGPASCEARSRAPRFRAPTGQSARRSGSSQGALRQCRPGADRVGRADDTRARPSGEVRLVELGQLGHSGRHELVLIVEMTFVLMVMSFYEEGTERYWVVRPKLQAPGCS